MTQSFPGAIAEIPVSDIQSALTYYESRLGFARDWVSTDYGIAGIVRGACRLYLSNAPFRQNYGNAGPVVVWLNLSNRAQVDDLYGQWRRAEAQVSTPPESVPWNLYEFTATDLDGNVFRVFSSLTDET